MIKLLPLCGLLLLAACGGSDPAADEAGPAEAAPVATGAAEPAGGNALEAQSNSFDSSATAASATTPFDWTGRFAANRDLCSGGVWRFERNQVVTDGETACSINNSAEDPGAVKLNLACSAEGMDSLENWTLTPAAEGGAERGMRVVREAGGKRRTVDLIRCG